MRVTAMRVMTGVALLALGATALIPADGGTLAHPRPLPAFTHAERESWINSAPLTRAGLRGSVVVVDVWAFECWNCYRSFPWLNAVRQRFADRGLRVVGVHAPEFDAERVRASVVAKVHEFGLDNPVMMDNDHSYWNALGNRFWPTFYVVDRDTRIRGVFIGETHAGDARARQMESLIEQLLSERAGG